MPVAGVAPAPTGNGAAGQGDADEGARAARTPAKPAEYSPGIPASSVEALLDAAREANLPGSAPKIEQIAGDEHADLGARVAAVRALIILGRPESLIVLDKCAQSKQSPTLAKFSKMAADSIRAKGARAAQ